MCNTMSQIITYTNLKTYERRIYKNKIYTTKAKAEKALKELKKIIKKNPKLQFRFFNLRMKRIG